MPGSATWSEADVPDQSGRVVVVTGGNSGIGLEAAKMLAGRGAHVVLACRDPGRAQAALGAVRAAQPKASVDAAALDLASLASVRAFAAAFSAEHPRLDVLLNNAGVMAIPRRTTADGFEMQLGTNHFGHFALTGLLLPRLLAAPAPRVVNVSSGAHRTGRIRFDDLQSERSYGPWKAYSQSKLANLLFTFELQRRLDAARKPLRSVAAHPGYAATNLQAVGPQMSGSALMERAMALANRVFAQDAHAGALPSVYAAAAEDVRGAEYFGPDGFGEMWGNPTRVQAVARAHDSAVAAQLFQVSETLTGVRFEGLA